MKNPKALPWVVGTALVSLVVLLFTWFIVVSPARESASTDRTAAAQQKADNDMLIAKNAQLARDFANIEEFRTELAEGRKLIPTTIDQPTFSRELDNLAKQSGVRITNIAFLTSVNIADAAPSVPVPAPAAESGDAAATPAPDASVSIAGAIPPTMYGIPLKVTVIGSPDDTKTFVDRMQTGTGRLVLVSDLSINRLKEKPATDNVPAIKDGDYETTVSGFTYILQDNSAPAPNVEEK